MTDGFVVGTFPIEDDVIEISFHGGAPNKLWTAMLVETDPLPVEAVSIDGIPSKNVVAQRIVGEWRYLRATDPMADAVVDDWPTGCGHSFRIVQGEALGWSVVPPWWAILGGMEGPTGAEYLHRIIGGLEADPERFSALCRREDGLGDRYESLLEVLRAMRAAVPEKPCRWAVYG